MGFRGKPEWSVYAAFRCFEAAYRICRSAADAGTPSSSTLRRSASRRSRNSRIPASISSTVSHTRRYDRDKVSSLIFVRTVGSSIEVYRRLPISMPENKLIFPVEDGAEICSAPVSVKAPRAGLWASVGQFMRLTGSSRARCRDLSKAQTSFVYRAQMCLDYASPSQ
jgi:hypothetical protein